MRVELFYFDGCPHWSVAHDRLREAMRAVGRDDRAVLRHEVLTPAQAEAIGFTGSPTIRVNGKDPFATVEDRIGFACRIYRTPTGFDGSPTVAQFVEALA